jgi:hypothetical protein
MSGNYLNLFYFAFLACCELIFLAGFLWLLMGGHICYFLSGAFCWVYLFNSN